MRIGIDGSSILSERTGIGNYTFHLIQNLLRVDKKNEYVIFLNSYTKEIPDYAFLSQENAKVKHYRIPGPLLIKLWKYLHIPPIDFLIGKVDVFHSPASYIPPQMRGFRVTTIHDIYFMRNPESCEKLGGKFLLSTLPRILSKMDKIIVPSFFTKNEITALLKIPEEKIVVIYEGVDHSIYHSYYNEIILDGILKEYCLPQNYILFVGTIEPRKNVEGLLLAYKRLQELVHNPPKLVIVGRRGMDSEKVFELVMQLNIYKDVIFTGYIPQEHLPLIYRNSLIFVYPSFYEGFGLPVLEAMTCGVPVIISDNSALVEIAGEAGVIVDSNNYYQMAEKMRELITSHRLREDLQKRAFDVSRRYSWDLTAKKTIKVYEDLFNSRNSEKK